MTLSAADRLDILRVLARADTAATRRDVEGYVALFTDDAVLDGAKGEHQGKDLLRQSVGPIWAAEGPTSMHRTLNAVADPVEGQADRAVATSVLLVLAGEKLTSVHSVSTIVQHLVKVGPDWQIEHRFVRSMTEVPAQQLSS
jgi:ketosteroid isomerase-like protein